MLRKILVGHTNDEHGEDARALAELLASAGTAEILAFEAPHGESAADALSAAASEENVDAVVLGPTHRGFAGRLLHGTTAAHVAGQAAWPVLVAPRGYRDQSPSLKMVGVALDSSADAHLALTWAAGLAGDFGAALRLMTVVEPPPPPPETGGPDAPLEAWSTVSLAEVNEVEEITRTRLGKELAAAAESVGRADAETVTL